VKEDASDLEILRIGEEIERRQRDRVAATRAARDEAAVKAALDELTEAAAGQGNLMPVLLGAARLRATQGEIVEAMKDVFGGYREPVRI